MRDSYRLVPTAAAAIGIVLPFTGLSHVLGFTPLPAAFFLVLVVLIVAYIVLVDAAKALFYRAHGARPAAAATQRAQSPVTSVARKSRTVPSRSELLPGREGADGDRQHTTAVRALRCLSAG
jgi:hypothetical protein